jgi:hypothetical protein
MPLEHSLKGHFVFWAEKRDSDMQWFKHHNNFRNTPAMQYVEQMLGASGVASVYRLYEVFTERFGVDNTHTEAFSGSLKLAAPTSEQWLCTQILFTTQEFNEADGEEYTAYPQVADLKQFLTVCETAGIITIKREKLDSFEIQRDGSKKSVGNREWLTITIPEFAQLADVYSARKKNSKALETTR